MIKNYLITISIFLLSLSSSHLYATSVGSESNPKKDTRVVRSENSPLFLDAVGKVKIIFPMDNSKKMLQCSGSLISSASKINSRLVITAAHCLRAGEFLWVSETRSGSVIKRKARVLDYYTNHHIDYAFLLLDDVVSVEDIQPLLIDFDSDIRLDKYHRKVRPRPTFYVAGYSSDSVLGDSGKVLTYTKVKRLSLAAGPEGGVVKARSYGGSSGGAVISFMDLRNGYGKAAYLTGVLQSVDGSLNDNMSDLNGGDETIFIEHVRFHEDAKAVFDKYEH
ncbi:trypsin-like serine peptidase [Vibrio sp. HN007]|uniref:trypsin-like serine peptidase n=1 Tax=Vibrio iocasae TaxID=3098914 RepID=UPI0035D3FC97